MFLKEYILYAKKKKPNIIIIITMQSMDDLCVSPIYLYQFLIDLRDRGYPGMGHSFFHMRKSGTDSRGVYVGPPIVVSFTDLISTYESLVADEYTVDDVHHCNVAFYIYMFPKWLHTVDLGMDHDATRNSAGYV